MLNLILPLNQAPVWGQNPEEEKVMMKKYSWIAALILALSLAFIGCPNNPKDPVDPVDPDLPDEEIPVSSIVLKAAGSQATGAGFTVTDNKVKLVDQGNLSNVGFYYEFPADVIGKGYGTIEVEMEVISIDDPDFIGLMTFSSTQFTGPVAVIDQATGAQKTGQYDHEFKLGERVEKGSAGDTKEGGDGFLDGSTTAGEKYTEAFPFNKFTDRIAWQVNAYAGNITSATTPITTATWEIAVSKITFTGGKVADTVIDVKAIPGVTAPMGGGIPAATVETNQYTGTVEWDPEVDEDDGFAVGTEYTATITLTAKTGFTLTGVAADFFTVAGATATNAENSGVVTAVFPKTEAPPDGVKITVGGVVQEVQPGAIGGTATPTADGKGYTLTKTASYQGAFGYFPITFASGTKLSDFDLVTFNVTGVSGDTGYKRFALMASATEFAAGLSNDAAVAAIAVNENSTSSQIGPQLNPVAGGAAVSGSFILDAALTAAYDTTTTVWFSIYFGSSNTAVVTISDIVFRRSVPVTSVTITGANTVALGGATITLDAEVLPINADNKTLTWASSDPTVATVTAGVVTPVKAGSTNITATAGGVTSAVFAVTVTKVDVTSVTISGTGVANGEAELTVADTLQLEAEVLPANATLSTVTWTSDDEDVATVSSDGLVTAASVGTATITATADGVSDEVEITVVAPLYDVVIGGDDTAPVAIPLAAPSVGKVPATTVTATALGFSGTVTWSPDDSVFEPETVYTATIVLAAAENFTFDGALADNFKVGTVAGTNTAGTDKTLTVEVEFPETGEAFQITIQGATGATTYVGYDDIRTVNATVTPIANGYEYTYSGNSYNWSLAAIMIDFGDKTLEDFKEVKLTYTSVSGDYRFKILKMLAAKADVGLGNGGFNHDNVAVTPGTRTTSYSNQTEDWGNYDPKNMTLPIPGPANNGDNGLGFDALKGESKLEIAFYYHAGGTGPADTVEAGNTTAYTIASIEFVAKD